MAEKNKRRYATPAPIIKRFVAFAIDLFILNIIVLGPFNGLVMGILPEGSGGFSSSYRLMMENQQAVASLSGIMAAVGILSLLYFVALQRRFGQTVGMMVMDIYAVKVPRSNDGSRKDTSAMLSFPVDDRKDDLHHLGFFETAIRNLFALPIGPLMFLWIIDPLSLVFSKSSQRFLEMLSGTMTVELSAYNHSQRWSS